MPGEADFTADERKVYRAVGKAHSRNNLPIFTHNNYGTGPDVPREIALRQLDVYESVGVDLRRVVAGHMDSLPGSNPDIILAVAKRGAFVGIDRVRGDVKGDADRVKLVLALLDAGYGDQLLLSSDTRRDYNKVSRFLAQLREAGVKDDMLRHIMSDNARRFLAFVPKKSVS
jgi:phosphotriesterase-related protein